MSTHNICFCGEIRKNIYLTPSHIWTCAIMQASIFLSNVKKLYKLSDATQLVVYTFMGTGYIVLSPFVIRGTIYMTSCLFSCTPSPFSKVVYCKR